MKTEYIDREKHRYIFKILENRVIIWCQYSFSIHDSNYEIYNEPIGNDGKINWSTGSRPYVSIEARMFCDKLLKNIAFA